MLYSSYQIYYTQ
ncbi:hypothetical protein F383_26597 [Gossypium arboreum]|uniref:Uncharacterized protein n=1 Tax=Gossypium arboreum TaxID=29729 RepID=A0A0B0PC59_GOSAR|nr:hypothetical protein F383_26597 [Gossypium arboreum]